RGDGAVFGRARRGGAAGSAGALPATPPAADPPDSPGTRPDGGADALRPGVRGAVHLPRRWAASHRPRGRGRDVAADRDVERARPAVEAGAGRLGGMQRAVLILWPSFLVAAVAEMVFFALFDPGELSFFGQPLELSRIAIYSIGFFLFWVFAAASSALSLALGASGDER